MAWPHVGEAQFAGGTSLGGDAAARALPVPEGVCAPAAAAAACENSLTSPRTPSILLPSPALDFTLLPSAGAQSDARSLPPRSRRAPSAATLADGNHLLALAAPRIAISLLRRRSRAPPSSSGSAVRSPSRPPRHTNECRGCWVDRPCPHSQPNAPPVPPTQNGQRIVLCDGGGAATPLR